MKGHCHVANDDCKAPAGYRCASGACEAPQDYVSECHRCGEPVCTSEGCSTKIRLDHKMRRVCVECKSEIEQVESVQKCKAALRLLGVNAEGPCMCRACEMDRRIDP